MQDLPGVTILNSSEVETGAGGVGARLIWALILFRDLSVQKALRRLLVRRLQEVVFKAGRMPAEDLMLRQILQLCQLGLPLQYELFCETGPGSPSSSVNTSGNGNRASADKSNISSQVNDKGSKEKKELSSAEAKVVAESTSGGGSSSTATSATANKEVREKPQRVRSLTLQETNDVVLRRVLPKISLSVLTTAHTIVSNGSSSSNIIGGNSSKLNPQARREKATIMVNNALEGASITDASSWEPLLVEVTSRWLSMNV